MKKAIVIFSGGLDSTVCISIAIEKGYDVHPITFDYGQSNKNEIESAKRIAKYYNLQDKHKIFKIDFYKDLVGNALTDRNIDIPDLSEAELNSQKGIPIVYVPGRNQNFLSIATAYAEVIDADFIYLGITAADYSGQPDCRPEFIEAFQKTINLGTARAVKGEKILIETPLVNMKKDEIIKLAVNLKSPLELTTTCFRGEEKACGTCGTCTMRLIGFREAGIKDPIKYKGDIND